MSIPSRVRRPVLSILVPALSLVSALILTSISGCGCRKDPVVNGNGTTRGTDRESDAILDALNLALTDTENLEPENAAPKWDRLRELLPDDPSIALNRALNAVLRVDRLTATATDSVNSAEEKKAARSELPAAIDTARQAIDEYQQISGDAVTKLWLSSRIDAHEANLLSSTISKSLRRGLFDRLAAAIDGELGEDPRSAILGGTLVELIEKMSDPVDGLPEPVRTPAAKSLVRLSNQNDDNLFLAMQALKLAIESQDQAAPELVERTWQLAKAVEPTIAAFTKPIGITPRELADQISKSVADDDWQQASQSLVLWSNVLNPLEIVRTDRRRSSPHPLDRLNFDTVRRLSAEISGASPIAPSESPLAFSDDIVARDSVLALPIDADLDLTIDLVTVSEDGKLELLQDRDGQWTATAELQLDSTPAGMIAADLFMVDSSDSGRIKRSPGRQADDPESEYAQSVRHDTLPGMVLFGDAGIRLVQIDTRKSTAPAERLTKIESITGLEDLPAIGAVTVGDLEGDGDLDLIVAPVAGSLRVFVNRGNRTFFPAEIGSITADPEDPVADLAIADLDRDIDLDVITIHESGRIGILENLLHLQFRFRWLESVPALPSGDDRHLLSIAVEDVDSNAGWDLIATSGKQSAVAFGNSSDIGVWTVDRVETSIGMETPPALGDFDNDAFLELVGGKSMLRLGPWGLNESAKPTGIPSVARRMHVADLNEDGKLDLVHVENGTVAVGTNQIADPGNHLDVRFRGIADNAAASGRVNHYAIGSVLELRFGPYYRSRIVNGPVTHFGIDSIESADSIRVIMPNGLTQMIRDPKINSLVEEEQTLKGSCPYLYSWDGEKFAFVTDCLWAAPLGLQVASGIVQKDRPWEYLRIDGEFVHENADGQYELRLTEELWEVAYVDHVELIAVDHPADVDIFTNEKVGPPNIASPKTFAFAHDELYPVRSATDTDGDEITSKLSRSDEDYVQGFDRRLRQGLCPPHWIDMDFGPDVKDRLAETPDASVMLVLRGWILPTDTSLNIQIDQNPELPAIEFPSVWVPNPDAPSEWQRAIEYMGFPGGKTKTIVVDLTEHLAAADPRVRVRTSAQIYWDSAFLAVQDAPVAITQHRLSLDQAEVAFHGFSSRSKPDPAGPEVYDYADADRAPKWPPLRGEVTRFGDCTDRLAAWDDSMVVISGGDEIRMKFDAPEDPVPAGWERDFVLHCVGWDKDADLNTLTGQSIGPLPIRDMSAYPPTAESADRFAAVLHKNADSLRRRQSFRAFWHRERTPSKAFLPAEVSSRPPQP